MTYTYDPRQIGAKSVSRVRFELGDTAVDGGADTAYLSDEEIDAMLTAHPTSFRAAKIALAESVYMRLSYEVNTRVGPLTLELQSRADHWKKLLDDLKGGASTPKAPGYTASASGQNGSQPYFYSGMHDNEGAEGVRR